MVTCALATETHFITSAHVRQWSVESIVKELPHQMWNHAVSPIMVLAWFQCLHHHCWHILDNQVSILSSFMHFELLLPHDSSMIQLSSCHSAHRYPFEFPNPCTFHSNESPTAPHFTRRKWKECGRKCVK